MNWENFQFPFLLDIGASISLVNRQHFEEIKYLLTVKYLSRKANISTVNSVVHFSVWIQFSFKIGLHFLNHHFYLIDTDKQSRILIILGVDAINEFNIRIHPQEKCCIIGDTTVPFMSSVDVEENDFLQHKVVTAIQNHVVDKPQFLNCNTESLLLSNNVVLGKKSIIEPKDRAYVMVHTKIPSHVTKQIFNFESATLSKSIEVLEVASEYIDRSSHKKTPQNAKGK